jgi:hypothetical protein
VSIWAELRKRAGELLKEIYCLWLAGMCQHALYIHGITEISTAQCTKLVGFGTDGAAANASKQRLNEKELKWVVWMW